MLAHANSNPQSTIAAGKFKPACVAEGIQPPLQHGSLAAPSHSACSLARLGAHAAAAAACRGLGSGAGGAAAGGGGRLDAAAGCCGGHGAAGVSGDGRSRCRLAGGLAGDEEKHDGEEVALAALHQAEGTCRGGKDALRRRVGGEVELVREIAASEIERERGRQKKQAAATSPSHESIGRGSAAAKAPRILPGRVTHRE